MLYLINKESKVIKKFENEKHLLKNELMDRLHKEFLDIYNGVDLNSIQSIKNKLIELYKHTQKHFELEEELMDNIDYPTKREHKDEHAKVLSEMNYFINMNPTIFGKNIMKAYYIEKLPYWFDAHLISMDSDLASYSRNQMKIISV
ncbi:MAG TPA: hemerythrin [Campylobacterales bacterium]|jgi:hemerythrin-like metal-binding protein|nr:hemerythrin [Campylobacterales bacterium]HHC11330.1 hemerythrin [Campylobacterales bacterium]HHD81553.1 hemerythrin [Campylobacterales bacterium]